MRDRLAGATALAALLLGAGASLAQQPVVIGGSGQPSVYVNTQVLNSLTPGFAPGSPYAPYNHGAYGYRQPGAFGQPAYGQPAYGQQQPARIGGYYITRPGTLLFPPQQFPRSQVTVSPQQLAALQTAPATPSGSVELTPPSAQSAPASAPPAPGAVPSSMPSLPAPAAASAASAPAQEQTAAAPRVPNIPAPGAPEAPAAPAAADVGASEGQVPAIPPPSLPAAAPPAPEALAPIPPAPNPAASNPSASNPSAPEPPAPAEEAAAEPASDTARSAPPPPSLPPEPDPPAKAETPAETQTAALPPASETAGPQGSKRLIFAEGSADLDEAAKQVLRAAAETLKTDQNARVQLLAYASSDDDSASRARRLSLSRALAVRQFLIKEGIRSTRMDVRALGNKFEDGPADRVDILPANR